MLKEIFKKQAVITKVDETGIEFEIRLAMPYEELAPNAIRDVLKSSVTRELTANDKLFFMPGCTVPRFKVKQLCERTGMSVTKTPDSCTIAISGTNTSKQIVDHEYNYYCFKKEEILDFIDNNYTLAFPGVIAIKSFLEKEENLNIVACSNYSVKSNLVRKAASESFPKYLINSPKDNYNLWVTEEKLISDFDKIFDKNIPIVHQDDLLSIINGNNIMDEEMYQETKKMFDSEDTNNHVLAMELMANCDYEKSCIYLLLLLKDYSSEIRNRKEKDHVNFKALRSFFDIKLDAYLDLDRIIKVLQKKNLLSKSDLPLLLKLAHEEFNNSINSDFFCGGQIEANDELLNALEKADQLRAQKQSGNVQNLEENAEHQD